MANKIMEPVPGNSILQACKRFHTASDEASAVRKEAYPGQDRNRKTGGTES